MNMFLNDFFIVLERSFNWAILRQYPLFFCSNSVPEGGVPVQEQNVRNTGTPVDTGVYEKCSCVPEHNPKLFIYIHTYIHTYIHACSMYRSSSICTFNIL